MFLPKLPCVWSGRNATDNLGRGSCFGALQGSSCDVLVRTLLTDATGHAFFKPLREGTPTLGCGHWSSVRSSEVVYGSVHLRVRAECHPMHVGLGI